MAHNKPAASSTGDAGDSTARSRDPQQVVPWILHTIHVQRPVDHRCQRFGPTQVARHFNGAVTADQLGFVDRRHIDIADLRCVKRGIGGLGGGEVCPFMLFVTVSSKNPRSQNALQSTLDDMLRRDFDRLQVLEVLGISQTYSQRTVAPGTTGKHPCDRRR